MSEGKRMAVFSFITPRTLTQQTRFLTKVLQRHKWFDQGDLLDTMEKGVLYPIIHYAEGNQPPLQDPSALGQEYNLQQGLYVEVKYSCPATKMQIKANKACIFMGFKKLDSFFSEVLEESWKDWTGARLLYMNLSRDFGLSRISFYRRVAPVTSDIFMYIVTMECEYSDNKMQLLDLVQRLRVERMMGYLSVYRVESVPPSTANVIDGLLTEDVIDSSGKVNI